MASISHTVGGSANLVEFDSAARVPFTGLRVHFKPTQSGEGEPSPSNVRPIVGWNECEIYEDDVYIPKEYQRVEYLQSSGTQYINTGIIAKQNIIVDAKIEIPTGAQVSNNGILGSRRDSTGGRMYLISFYDGKWNFGIETDVSLSVGTIFYDKITRVHSEVANNKYLLKINDEVISSGNSTFQGNDWPLYLFGANNYGNFARAMTVKVYSLSIVRDDVLVLNYIPCYRKSDSKPGMYDTVTSTFFTNSGAGEFICGPDVGTKIPITFPVLGKNKFDSSSIVIVNHKAKDSNGVEIDSTNNKYNSNYIAVVPSTMYTISGLKGDGTNIGYQRLYFYTKEQQWITRSDYFLGSSFSFTTPSNCFYLQIQGCKNETYADIQLELGSTSTTYEPYSPNNTVYGGYVDVAKGEVVATLGYYTNTWGNGQSATVLGNNERKLFYTETKFLSAGSTGFVKCNIINEFTRDSSTYNEDASKYMIGNNLIIAKLPVNISNDTVVQFVSELATPIHYPIAPTTLKTLLGHNAVWSNTNDVTALDYAIHDSAPIRAAKARICANEPHIATATGAIANFNTDMKAPIKSCKVSFLPVQSGSGDPSPTNVRAISGWTGVDVYQAGKNLIDESYLRNASSYSNAGSYGYYYTDDIQLVPNTRYRFVWYDYNSEAITEIGYTVHMYVAGANEYIIDTSSYRQYSSGFLTPADGKIRFGIYVGSSSVQKQTVLDTIFGNGKLLLQTGTSNVTYEHYTGTTIPVDWTTEAGTIYGGYVDLVKGELVETYHKIVADGVNVKCNSSYLSDTLICAGIVYLSPLGKYSSVTNSPNVYIDTLPMYTQSYILHNPGVAQIPFATCTNAGNQYIQLYIANRADYPDVTDATTCKAFVNAWLQEHPTTIVYELVTPITYTLTPTQLKTLIGQNNIWSNANGTIETKYWTH